MNQQILSGCLFFNTSKFCHRTLIDLQNTLKSDRIKSKRKKNGDWEIVVEIFRHSFVPRNTSISLSTTRKSYERIIVQITSSTHRNKTPLDVLNVLFGSCLRRQFNIYFYVYLFIKFHIFEHKRIGQIKIKNPLKNSG